MFTFVFLSPSPPSTTEFFFKNAKNAMFGAPYLGNDSTKSKNVEELIN